MVAASALLDRYGSVVDHIEHGRVQDRRPVYSVLEGENPAAMAKTTGLGLLELATVFDNLKPDVVVTVADRYETLSTAIAAAYMNIPVAHVQGGEVTGSIDEKVRHAVTKLADLHLVSTAKAAERVIRMGEDPSTVFVTGCPSIDLVARDPRRPVPRFRRVRALRRRRADRGPVGRLPRRHAASGDDRVRAGAHACARDAARCRAIQDLPTLWFWPNVDAGADGTSSGIRAFREQARPSNIHFFKNMAPDDFLRLLYNSRCLIGNSSVGIRECSYLGVPVVNIGSRQAGRDRGGNVIDAGYDRRDIAGAIQRHLNNGRYARDPLYGDGNAGPRIADCLTGASLRIDKKLAY